MAGEPGPVDRVLAFIYMLLGGAAPSVEGHYPLGLPAQIGDDEADKGEELAGVPRHLAPDAAGLDLEPAISKKPI